MEKTLLTVKEEEFYKHLRKALMFKGFDYEFKVPLYELCKDHSGIMEGFMGQVDLINDIAIDIVLKKNGKVVGAIEVIDEPDEINNNRGENMLKDILFLRLGCEYYRVVDQEHLKEAALSIKQDLLKKMKA